MSSHARVVQIRLSKRWGCNKSPSFTNCVTKVAQFFIFTGTPARRIAICSAGLNVQRVHSKCTRKRTACEPEWKPRMTEYSRECGEEVILYFLFFTLFISLKFYQFSLQFFSYLFLFCHELFLQPYLDGYLMDLREI